MKNKKLLVATVSASPVAAMADASATITAAQGEFEGIVESLATAVGAVALAALAIWVIPVTYRWLKGVARGK